MALGIGRIGYRTACHSGALFGRGVCCLEQKDQCPEGLKGTAGTFLTSDSSRVSRHQKQAVDQRRLRLSGLFQKF
jgi:hypothetical protein